MTHKQLQPVSTNSSIKTRILCQYEQEFIDQAVVIIIQDLADSINEALGTPGLINAERLENPAFDDIERDIYNESANKNVSVLIEDNQVVGVIMYGKPRKKYFTDKKYPYQIYYLAIKRSHHHQSLKLRWQLLYFAMGLMMTRLLNGLRPGKKMGAASLVMECDPLTNSHLELFDTFGAQSESPAFEYQFFAHLNFKCGQYIWPHMQNARVFSRGHLVTTALRDMEEKLPCSLTTGGADYNPGIKS